MTAVGTLEELISVTERSPSANSEATDVSVYLHSHIWRDVKKKTAALISPDIQSCIPQSVLRLIHSLLQRDFCTGCDVVLLFQFTVSSRFFKVIQ